MPVIERPQLHRWDYGEWHRATVAGALDGMRIELIGGQVIDKFPSNPPLRGPAIHRWDYAEWGRLVSSGIFDQERVELIGGEIVDMAPQWEPHVGGVILAASAMRKVFGEADDCVRTQSPLRVGRNSDPEPDVAVLKGNVRDYINTTGHPSNPLIVIEVSVSSLDYDPNDKASLYASGGITDYWILNVDDCQLELHREPVKDAAQRFGHRYSNVTILKSGDLIAPLAAKNSPVPVADLLP
jgi:Uma2 family endonuclease